MPLEHGKSHKAFAHNIEAERAAGKPEKQSLAIAFAMKRRAKKMKDGGFVRDEEESGYVPMLGDDIKDNAMAHEQDDKMLNQHGEDEIGPEGRHMKEGGEMKSRRQRMMEASMGMAEGGEIKDKSYGSPERLDRQFDEKGVHTQFSSRENAEAARKAGYKPSKAPHERVLNELRSMPNPKLQGLAEGGEPELETTVRPDTGYGKVIRVMSAHGGDIEGEDMVGRIMRKRQHMYSHGGEVANDDHPFEYEFEEPNNFDDLARRDELSFHDTGKNSGDELGDDRVHDDLVDRIMLKRKKQHNPGVEPR